jgi:4a-hydroxytetrahydrobiopterin dehydratase
MEPLESQKCEACRPGAPRMSDDEIAVVRRRVPDWEVRRVRRVPRLVRTFEFPDFAAALAFTDRVGAAAEAEDHHPAILTEWGSVTVSWWSHKIQGLHRNDFIMAAKTDSLFKGAGPAA